MPATHSPVVYLYLNCRLLEERIVRTTRRLQGLVIRPDLDSSRLRRYLADLGTIFDEVQRCNFFWCQVLAMNYFIALLACSICFLCGKLFRTCFLFIFYLSNQIFDNGHLNLFPSFSGLYSDDVFMILSSGITFVLTYMSCLLLSFYICGRLHTTVSRNLFGCVLIVKFDRRQPCCHVDHLHERQAFAKSNYLINQAFPNSRSDTRIGRSPI